MASLRVGVAAALLSGAMLSMAGWAIAETSTIDQGRALLEANCARCHAIGVEGESKHKEAPPFRDVVMRYPPDNLAEALAEGLISGHPDMPEFVFEPDQVEAIVAYLNDLRAQGKAPEPKSEPKPE
ncbi:cytochrome c [Hyphomicrobium sp. NDB2Meth4]|uniref:c-type cytochrome n=1 Tax=Hyphomicrobium sp. NDB2Meth4 TaxID=1892846 RepID=UPI0032AFDD31